MRINQPIFSSFKETSYLCRIISPYFLSSQFVSLFAVFTFYCLQEKRRKAITIPENQSLRFRGIAH